MEMGELEKAISRGGDAMMAVTGEPCGFNLSNYYLCKKKWSAIGFSSCAIPGLVAIYHSR
jgi:hypothetical protein